VKVVKGGLDVPDDTSNDIAVIASAAVAVRFEARCLAADSMTRRRETASIPINQSSP
jgi:hypothetical protein